MQVVERILLAIYVIAFFSPYTRCIGDLRVHFFSLLVFFTLIASVTYEYNSTFFTMLHSFCYVYFLTVTAFVVKSSMFQLKK